MTKVDLPPEVAVYANRETVYTGCDPAFTDRESSDGGALHQYFDTASGAWKSFASPMVAPGQQLTGQSCIVIPRKGGAQRAVYLQRLKTPPQGLTPESETVSLMAFDDRSSSPVVSKPLNIPEFATSSSQWAMFPTVDGFALHGGYDASDKVYFFNGDTLDITASSTDSLLDAFNAWGFAQRILVPGSPPTNAVEFKDTAGTTVGRFDDIGISAVSTVNGFMMDHDRQPGMYYFDMKSKQIAGPITSERPYADDTYVSGLPAVFADYEFDDKLLLASRTFLKVFDTSTMSEMFSLDQPQLDGLHIDAAQIGANHLYLTNDSDSPVVDLRTKEPVSKGWSLRPLLLLTDGWAVIRPVSPGASEYTGTCFNYLRYGCSKMYEGAYLLRKSNTAYDGPWF